MTTPNSTEAPDRSVNAPATPSMADAAANLRDLGLSTDTIALAFSRPENEIREMIRTTTPSPSERELAGEVRSLVHLALLHSHHVLKWGSPADKIAITRALISTAGKLVGEDPNSSLNDVRANFAQLMGSLRSAPQLKTVITDVGAMEVPADDH